MDTQNENKETVLTSAYNPFPEPQTIPSGWDTSVIFSAPQPACTDQAEDREEGEVDSARLKKPYA